jgi:hypothetical protein
MRHAAGAMPRRATHAAARRGAMEEWRGVENEGDDRYIIDVEA